MDYESGLVKPATQIDERWLRRLKHAPDRVAARLVIFPHAGGSASYFRPMEQFLHPQIDVLAVQYPGRQDRRVGVHKDHPVDVAATCLKGSGRTVGEPAACGGTQEHLGMLGRILLDGIGQRSHDSLDGVGQRLPRDKAR